MERITLITKPQKEYELLDSGKEEKLERFGAHLLARPDPQALWEKKLGEGEWGRADAKYVREKEGGKWKFKNQNPPADGWQIEFGGLQFLIRPTSFKHTGLFPEQLPNWEWMREILTQKILPKKSSDLLPLAGQTFSSEISTPSVLNLFGYTGGATLAAAAAGAEVCHVDASKTAVAWARENAAASGLADKPIRWIVEDVLVFMRREIKRGKRYNAIIMDPPAFGHGPKDELWKIEEHLLELIKLCGELLSEKSLFVLLNGYAAGYSALAFAYNLEPLVQKFTGTLEYGDLTIEEKGSGRLLPCGIFARLACRSTAEGWQA